MNLENLKKFNSGDLIVSVRAKISNYTGGNHSNVEHITWNWNKNQKKFLSLSDFIKTKAQFEKMKTDIKQAISKLPKVESSVKDTNWFDEGITKLQDIKTWNIDGDKFVITFDPYQIASYNVGIIEVSVPKP